MFLIGMIEDKMSEASSVMLSLIVNSAQIEEASFKLYDLSKKEDDTEQDDSFQMKLFEEIKNDVIAERIQCLIVDYKLDTLSEVLEGIDIVNYMHNLVPEFPVIVLTDYPENGKANDKVDPDKVYAKAVFMKPDAAETKQMVYHIIRNLERYTKRRSELEIERDQVIDILSNRKQYDEDAYVRLIDIERELARYMPVELTAFDEAFDTSKMEEALQLLKEYKELLE